jgi:hypothetical protein
MDSAFRDDLDALLTSFLGWGWGNYEADPPLQILWELSLTAAERDADVAEDSVHEHVREVLLRAGRSEEEAFEVAGFISARIGAITGAMKHMKVTAVNRRLLPFARTRPRHAACTPSGDPRWSVKPRRRTWEGGRIVTYVCASDRELAEYDGRYSHAGPGRYLHREDGPALESYHDESRTVLQDTVWYRRGRCHRQGAPALVYRDGVGVVRHEGWYLDGVRHRDDGPAETHYITEETRQYMRRELPVYGWWLGGEQMTFDGYLRRVSAPVRVELLRQAEHLRAAGTYFDPEVPERMPKTVFISYGGPDERFASRLNRALKSKGIQTWFFPDDAVAGEKLHRTMHEGVNKHDRVLLVCSRASLERRGVLNELERVFEREAREGGIEILLPVRIDDHVLQEWAPSRPDLAVQVRDRVIADFGTLSEDPGMFDHQLSRLLRALGDDRP